MPEFSFANFIDYCKDFIKYGEERVNIAKTADNCNIFLNDINLSSCKNLVSNVDGYIENDEKCRSVIGNLESGIYIFGHSHIQWTWQSEDGNITLINPGSCGLPLDGIKNSIPYTILEISDNGQASIEEKRIPFPMDEYTESLRKRDQYEKANVWTKLIIKELSSGFEHLYFFLRYVEEYADKIGDTRRPYVVDTWEKAYELWEAELETQNR